VEGVGDVKYMLLDITKAKNAGWWPKLSGRDAVRRTVNELISELGLEITEIKQSRAIKYLKRR